MCTEKESQLNQITTLGVTNKRILASTLNVFSVESFNLSLSSVCAAAASSACFSTQNSIDTIETNCGRYCVLMKTIFIVSHSVNATAASNKALPNTQHVCANKTRWWKQSAVSHKLASPPRARSIFTSLEHAHLNMQIRRRRHTCDGWRLRLPESPCCSVLQELISRTNGGIKAYTKGAHVFGSCSETFLEHMSINYL